MGKSKTVLADFRCKECNKLLGKIKGAAEIKCPKCNTINSIKQ